MDSPIYVRALTLNCWGIVCVSKDRRNRMQAIAKFLATSDLDFVCLQEVWSVSDYKYISRKATEALPFSHYFNSGVNGPGLCVLSKYPITDVYFHQWPINGYAHKIHQGDWFGGKGVGLCRIQMLDRIVNLYTTHLHAEYDVESMEYLNHRIVQSFDTSQFIKLTSSDCDLAILAGDLNSEPEDPAVPLLLLNAQLQDSFTVAQKRTIDVVGTNESTRNSYSPSRELKRQPEGKRIDYVMFKPGPRLNVNVLEYSYPLPDRVPGSSYSYSDHEAIQVTMECWPSKPVLPDDNAVIAHRNGLSQALIDATEICEQAIARLHRTKIWYYSWASAIGLALLVAAFIEVLTPFSDSTAIIFFNLFKVVLTIFLLFTFLMGFLWNRIEVSALLTCKYSMRLLLSQLNQAKS